MGEGPPGRPAAHSDKIEDFYAMVSLPDGHELPLKVFRPAFASSDGHPPIVMFDGGGFANCSVDQVTRPGRDFASKFNAVVVGATHRPAPKHPFSAWANNAWDVLVWLAGHAPSKFRSRPDLGFVVRKFSAWGNLGAVSAQRAMENKLQPAVTGSFISIAVLGPEEILPEKYRMLWKSRDLTRNDVFMSHEDIERMLEH